MVGPTFTLDLLIDTMIELKPFNVLIGTHYFVQLGEYDRFIELDTKLLESVKWAVPAGAAVPRVTVERLLEKFTNAKVGRQLEGL